MNDTEIFGSVGFPHKVETLKKTVFLSLMGIEKKWTQPIHNWGDYEPVYAYF